MKDTGDPSIFPIPGKYGDLTGGWREGPGDSVRNSLWGGGDWDRVDGRQGWEGSEEEGWGWLGGVGAQKGVPGREEKAKEKMEEPGWGETRTLPRGHQENGPEGARRGEMWVVT